MDELCSSRATPNHEVESSHNNARAGRLSWPSMQRCASSPALVGSDFHRMRERSALEKGGQAARLVEAHLRRAIVTSTIDRLNADLKDAMKARDAERTATLRMAISAMKYKTIERNAQLSEDEQLDVLRKQVKQRDDSIEEFQKAGRQDLVDKEARERDILQTYLPARMSGDALRQAVHDVLAGLPVDAKFGDAMKTAMGTLKDRADGKAIQEAVKAEMASRSAS